MYITRSAQDIARDAVQIFGGRGITKTGMGKHIEHVRIARRVLSPSSGRSRVFAVSPDCAVRCHPRRR